MSYALRSLPRLTFLGFALAVLASSAVGQSAIPAGQPPKLDQNVSAQPPASDTPGVAPVQVPQAKTPTPVPDSTVPEPAQLPVPPEIVWSPVRPAKPAAPEDGLVIAAVGDIMLGSTFPDTTGGSLPPQDGVRLLDEVAPFLKAADVSIGNLEGPLYDGPEPSAKCAHKAEGTCYAFRVPTRYAKLLADAGFVAMGVANNHAKDFGVPGQQSSIAALTTAGIAQSGAPGVVAHLLAKDKKVSYIAFATYPQFNNALDLDASAALVQSEAKLADFVIVSFHGGAEGSDRQHVPMGHEMFLGEDRGDLRTFTHAMIDAGAALVFGHGPHVVRGMEIYKGHLIAYSLGNFATFGHINLRGVNGLTLVLSARLDNNGQFLGGTVHAAYQEYPGGPHVDPKGQVLGVLRSLSRADFGATAASIAEDGTVLAPPVAPIQEKTATLPVAQN